MLNKETSAEMVRMAQVIKKYADASVKKTISDVEVENRRRAWLLTKILIEFAQHVEQSDIALTSLDETAITPAKMSRLEALAHNEERGMRWQSIAFKSAVEEFEKDDARTAKLREKAEIKAAKTNPQKDAAVKPRIGKKA